MNAAALSEHGLIYLATPYSKFMEGHENAFERASAMAGELLNRGVHCFCPIAHGHPIQKFGKTPPISHEQWMEFNMRFERACGALLVAQMAGWRESRGIADEILHFKAAGKPIFFLCPDTLAVDVSPLLRTTISTESRAVTTGD